MHLTEATALLHDPSTYVEGVPYAVLAELRREHGVVRVGEPEQAGWPGGPGLPDVFDPNRDARAHLAFGHGPHFCLGAYLARVQMKALFSEVLTRTSWIEQPGDAAYLRSNFQRGVKRLPIRWTP